MHLQDLSKRLRREAYRAKLKVRRAYIPKADGRAATARRSRAGRQDRPACRRRGAERDLRIGLPRVFVRVSATAQPASRVGCAHGRDHGEEGELGARRGHPELLRHTGAWMVTPLPRASCSGPARAATHPEMVERGRAGGGPSHGVREVEQVAGREYQPAPRQCLPPLRLRPVGSPVAAAVRARRCRSWCDSLTTSWWDSSDETTPNSFCHGPPRAVCAVRVDVCIPRKRGSWNSAGMPAATGGHVARGNPRASTFSGLRTAVRPPQTGTFTVIRRTMRMRVQAKLKAVKTELRRRMHRPLPGTRGVCASGGAGARAVLRRAAELHHRCARSDGPSSVSGGRRSVVQSESTTCPVVLQPVHHALGSHRAHL